tara:strand:+ start:96 stop:653 length:558 start_codon:yes stop_codon:yes gene_type:complete
MRYELFSVPFFIGNIDLKKIKLESDIGYPFEISKTPSSFGRKNTVDPESGDYLVETIIELLKEKYNNFIITINEIWRNKYLDNDYQEPHTHINTSFSFIIYEEIPTGAYTIFFNPAKYLIQATVGYDENIIPLKFKPDVNKGQIIIFPSYVEHMVNRNSDQVTISGNFDFQSKFGPGRLLSPHQN